jgi:photosystem II stability/assembly factor-like uncharacterized protein
MKKLFIVLLAASLCSGISSQQWVQQVVPSPVRPLYSVNALDANIVWACGEQGTVLYTSNGGANWLFRGGGALGNNTVYSIAGFGATTAICAVNNVQYGSIFRTSNAGLNWTEVYSQQGGFINTVKVTSVFSSIAYACGNPVSGRWLILRTIDGGITFDTTSRRLFQSGGEIGWPNAMEAIGNTIWLGTNNFRIYRSTNGGLTWYAAAVNMQNTYSIVFNGVNGFAVGNLGYYSTNSGTNWTPMPSLPGSGEFHAVANTGTNYWYGRSDEIFYSSNSGASFFLQYTSPTNGTFRQLSFITSASGNILSTVRGWGITNSGEMAHYSDPFGIIKISSEVPQSFQLFQNYPNPFNPETKIRFNVPYSSFVTINVYNAQGEEISKLVNSRLNTGSYEVNWNASAFSSGIYFCKLTADKFYEVRKMILIK